MKRGSFLAGLVIWPILAMTIFYPRFGQVEAQGLNLSQSQVVNARLNTLQKGEFGSKNGPKVGINEAYYWEIMHFSQTICVADSFSPTGYSLQYEEWDEWWKILSSDNKVVQKIIGSKLQVLVGICNTSRG